MQGQSRFCSKDDSALQDATTHGTFAPCCASRIEGRGVFVVEYILSTSFQFILSETCLFIMIQCVCVCVWMWGMVLVLRVGGICAVWEMAVGATC